jgi:hypothetical protein
MSNVCHRLVKYIFANRYWPNAYWPNADWPNADWPNADWQIAYCLNIKVPLTWQGWTSHSSMLISQWVPVNPVPSQKQLNELIPSTQVPLFRQGSG